MGSGSVWVLFEVCLPRQPIAVPPPVVPVVVMVMVVVETDADTRPLPMAEPPVESVIAMSKCPRMKSLAFVSRAVGVGRTRHAATAKFSDQPACEVRKASNKKLARQQIFWPAAPHISPNTMNLLSKIFSLGPDKLGLALLLRLPQCLCNGGKHVCGPRVQLSVALLQAHEGKSMYAATKAIAIRAEREVRTRLMAVTGLTALVLVLVLITTHTGAVAPA